MLNRDEELKAEVASPRCFAPPRWLDRRQRRRAAADNIRSAAISAGARSGFAVTACGRGLIGRQPVAAVDEHVDHFVTLADDTLVVSTQRVQRTTAIRTLTVYAHRFSLWQMESVVTTPATSLAARRSRRSVRSAVTHR